MSRFEGLINHAGADRSRRVQGNRMEQRKRGLGVPGTLSDLRRKFRLFRNAVLCSCSDAESSSMGRHKSAVAGLE